MSRRPRRGRLEPLPERRLLAHLERADTNRAIAAPWSAGRGAGALSGTAGGRNSRLQAGGWSDTILRGKLEHRSRTVSNPILQPGHDWQVIPVYGAGLEAMQMSRGGLGGGLAFAEHEEITIRAG